MNFKKSTNRLNPSRGWCNPAALPKGPNGRALCRECKTEVPENRKSFCSDKCVESWKIRSQPSHVRHKLFERDKGVCAVCKTDCKVVIQELEALDDYVAEHPYKNGRRSWDYEKAIRQNAPLMAKLHEFAISVHRYSHRRREGVWDADHVVAVVEGGGECGLDNYRTLCCLCHYVATRELQTRRMAARDARIAASQPPAPQ